MKYILPFLIIFITNITPVYSDDRSQTEKQFFFKNEHKIDDAPSKIQVDGASISDQIVKPNSIWERKDDEESKLDDTKPIEIDNQVVRMLPEQAIRALLDGNFISESVKAVGGTSGSLVPRMSAMNLYSALGNGMFQAQDIAAGRLEAAYEAYGTLADTQLFGDGFADSQALTSLNSCIHNHIKTNGSNWITAMYHCMGEGSPTLWKNVRDIQKVDIVKNNNVPGAVANLDPWVARITEKFKNNGDGEILLSNFLFKKLDENGDYIDDNDDVIKTIKENWLAWYGDYKLKFEGEKVGQQGNSRGFQITKIDLIPIVPEDEKGGKDASGKDIEKRDFTKKYEEVFKSRCEDFVKLWVELCTNNAVAQQSTGNAKPATNDEKAFWKFENTDKKRLIWNLTDHQVAFNINFMEGVETLLKNEINYDWGQDQCDNRIRNGMDCDSIQDSNEQKRYFEYARNYVKFLAYSQLLHAIQASQKFVFLRLADVTDVGNELHKMALNLIEKATGVENVQEAISENAIGWRLLINKLASTVTNLKPDHPATVS